MAFFARRAHPLLGIAMSDDAASPFVLRVEISAEQVPRLREALSASGNDGGLTRRTTDVAPTSEPDPDVDQRNADVVAREERLLAEQAELEERARRLSQREAELGSSDELTASERIRLA